MSEADKEFKESGFIKKEVDNLIVYEKYFKTKQKHELIRKVIGFNKVKKEVYGFDSYNGIDYSLGIDIPLNILKIINKKCKELGWI